MFEDLKGLLWPADHPPHLDRRRAEAIAWRVQAFALLFAALTVAFIVVDAAFLGPGWKAMAVGRLCAGAAFIAIFVAVRARPASMARARVALVVLFFVPFAFFAYAQGILHADGWARAPRFLEAAYTFVPFLLACGVAAFPLTAAEALAMALVAFAAQGWVVANHGTGAPPFMAADGFWLLFLIATIAAFAAVSQMKLIMALVAQMIRDPLTGCLRRESGEEILESQLALALRRGTPLSILFADLDRFKEVNDAFGHEAGDEVLVGAARTLRSLLRESDTLLRWGGEEFVMVLPDTSMEDAVKVVERLRRRPVAVLRDGRQVTVSVGVAEYRKDGVESMEALVGLADTRMYLAKQAGRNRYATGETSAPVMLAALEAASA